MSGNSIVKQMAIAAGLLVMGLAPGLGRAQSSAPASPTYQDQNQAAPQQGRKHDGEMANLNLTDDQKAQMKQIHESSKSQMDAVNNDSSLTADQKQAKLHQIHRGARMQMVKLLTPEQRQQLKADAKARHAARQQGQSEQTQPAAQPQSQP
jgi:periplasmic protein CpxP/Spy